MPTIDDVRHLLHDEHGLAVVSTAARDGRVLSSVVNVGVLDDAPLGRSSPSAAFVSAGGAARLAHIRRGAAVTITVRRGWRWAGVTGPATLVGPDDPQAGVDAETLRVLMRDIFAAAGGTHDDWDAYDRAMRDERRVAVLVEPERVLGRG